MGMSGITKRSIGKDSAWGAGDHFTVHTNLGVELLAGFLRDDGVAPLAAEMTGNLNQVSALINIVTG